MLFLHLSQPIQPFTLSVHGRCNSDRVHPPLSGEPSLCFALYPMLFIGYKQTASIIWRMMDSYRLNIGTYTLLDFTPKRFLPSLTTSFTDPAIFWTWPFVFCIEPSASRR